MTNDNVLQQLDDADLEIASLKMQLDAEREKRKVLIPHYEQQVKTIHQLRSELGDAQKTITDLIKFGTMMLREFEPGIHGFTTWAAFKSVLEDAQTLLGSEQLPRKEDE